MISARKKMKGGMMGTMMMALMGKAAILGPLMMMIIKLKVFKALVLSVLALFLSKLQLLKLLMKSKGGSTGGKGNEHVIIVQTGHDGHGGSSYGPPMGDGGWNSGGQHISLYSHKVYFILIYLLRENKITCDELICYIKYIVIPEMEKFYDMFYW